MYSLAQILKLLNISKLNEFQEKVINVFLGTNKNILMTAPTGVGKTTLMEIMMLLQEGRVIYASPLKALSYQVFNELNQIEPVAYITGDVYKDDAEKVDQRLIMTTYEKLDSMIRRNYEWLDQVKLLIIDELHNMKEEQRSEAIELDIVWALEKGIRIVTASATLSGLEKIRDWLNAELITYEKRIVPLFEFVRYGNYLISANGSVIKLKKDVIDMILEKGKNILIFENTRKKAESLANELKRRYGEIVTFFHGGLDYEERARILQDIMSGKIRIVVSTTALGQGVNLPIYCVYFKSLKLPDIENGRFTGWKMMDVATYKQISGRAGRPRYDKEGISVIEAYSENEAKYYLKNYIKGDIEEIKSYLTPFKYILVQLSRHEYMSLEELLKSFQYTYTLKNVDAKDIKETLEKMEYLELIGFQDVNGEKYVFLRPLGRACSYSYLDLEDIEYYKPFLEDEETDILFIIANSPKVLEVAKGGDTLSMLQDWVKGADKEDLTQYGANLTKVDVKKILDNAVWQSFAFYSLLRALDNSRQFEALMLWQQLEYGVPREAINLVKVKGIGRKIAIFLSKHGYTRKRDICANLQNVVNIMQQDENMKKQVHRITAICEKKK